MYTNNTDLSTSDMASTNIDMASTDMASRFTSSGRRLAKAAKLPSSPLLPSCLYGVL